MIRLCAAGLLVVLGGPGAGATSLPQTDGDVHLGVATCASSTCHGSTRPRESTAVLQNEYLTWHRRDAHADAYETLLTDRSRRIARRLGLGSPQNADTCLDCHADNVPASRRGEQFQLSDGVGCEACHGGADGWIRSHAEPGTPHGENLDNGLYPTEDPAARTRLCMSCHYSHPETPMTHRLMGAGHPPLLFDLDTFTQIQPTHHRVDADYRRRKGRVVAARTWAVGEAVGSRLALQALRANIADGQGLFPQLYYFDCASCHHELGSGKWARRPGTGLSPGSVRLEDASLQMLGDLLAELDPALAREWSAGLERLHAASERGTPAVRAAAADLVALAGRARERIEASGIPDRAGRGIVRRIAASGVEAGFADQSWAEQSVMALASLLTTAREESWYDKARQARLEDRLDGLYQALEAPSGYTPWRYRDAMRRFRQAAG